MSIFSRAFSQPARWAFTTSWTACQACSEGSTKMRTCSGSGMSGMSVMAFPEVAILKAPPKR